MIHLLAKAAEVRGEKEVGVNAGDGADRAGTQRARDAADARHIAAVLHDGVDAAGGLGARRRGRALRRASPPSAFRSGHDSPRQARRGRPRDAPTERRHRKAGRDDRATEARRASLAMTTSCRENSAARCLARSTSRSAKADDAQARNSRGGADPGSAHRPASDQGGLQLHRRVSPVPAVAVAIVTVNVYDVTGAPPPCQGAMHLSNTDDADPRRFERGAAPHFLGDVNALIGIRDLARHLDISIGTVSRALNDRADVNPVTRQRVREAAAKLGYSPNQSGRSLRRGKTDLVAMIVPSRSDDTLINTVFLSVLDGLKRRLGEDGLDLAIFLEGEKDGRLASLRRVTERGLADALIIADTRGADPRVEYLAKLRRPFVTFGRTKAAARPCVGRRRFRSGDRRRGRPSGRARPSPHRSGSAKGRHQLRRSRREGLPARDASARLRH